MADPAPMPGHGRPLTPHPLHVAQLPAYLAKVGREPMYFELMQAKLAQGAYAHPPDMRADFELVCANALAFNSAGTVYHDAAMQMLCAGSEVFDLTSVPGVKAEAVPVAVARPGVGYIRIHRPATASPDLENCVYSIGGTAISRQEQGREG